MLSSLAMNCGNCGKNRAENVGVTGTSDPADISWCAYCGSLRFNGFDNTPRVPEHYDYAEASFEAEMDNSS